MKYLSLICFFVVSFNLFAAGFLPNANIVKIQGTAFINNEEVKEGAEIAKGMLIKIPKKGDYIIVKFQNGHVVKFSEATVKVTELTEKISLFNLVKGQVYSLIKALTPDEKFIVRTRYASFGVRGTKYGISIDEKNKQAYLCVCEGAVEATKGKLTVLVKKDEDLLVGNKDKKLEVKTASTNMINMTNSAFEEFVNY